MRALRITDLLQAQGILLGAAPADKAAAVELLVSLQSVQGNLSNPAQFRQALMEREARSSTAIGSGIAVPHARSAAVLRPGLSAITAPGGVDWGAPDGSSAASVRLLGVPAPPLGAPGRPPDRLAPPPAVPLWCGRSS